MLGDREKFPKQYLRAAALPLAVLLCIFAGAAAGIVSLSTVERNTSSTSFAAREKNDQVSKQVSEPAAPTRAAFGMALADAARYRAIFEAQADGQWERADALIAALEDKSLLGHVLAQRYLHPTAYRSRFAELAEWLEAYGDHPQAETIYALALKRRPEGATLVAPVPVSGRIAAGVDEYALERAKRAAPATQPARGGASFAAEERLIGERLRQFGPLAAYMQLASIGDIERFAAAEVDAVRTRLAAALFFAGHDREAFTMAAAAAARSRLIHPIADWYAGLSAWRLKKYGPAAAHFEALAQSGQVHGWTAAAGGYWAGRAFVKSRQPVRAARAFRHAAQFDRTFYGILAHAALGNALNFDWDTVELTEAHIAALEATPAGRRALALLDAGQHGPAADELRRLPLGGNLVLVEAQIALATHHGMPQLALRLAGGASFRNTLWRDAGLFPIPPWEPQTGFRIDRALVYAVMRQESRFDPQAKSRAGASGLMQLMPQTARLIAKREAMPSHSRSALFEPSLNLELGQRYLAELMNHRLIRGDMVKLLASYNAGIGNVSNWLRNVPHGNDPLLFMESIPLSETRAFIEHVMRNYWMYRSRLGQETPSLEALAAGKWPVYEPRETPRMVLADNEQN
jgi:soluble lytic murein transglycosylase-like protein